MNRWLLAAAMVTVGVSSAGVYLPCLGADFVYDDVAQIVVDDYIHDPGHLFEVLSFKVLGRDVMDRNRPAMLLSLMVDSMVWGRNPFGYHLTNLLLHVACAELVLLLLWGILGRLEESTSTLNRRLLGALAGGLLFAVHPAGSEAVCPITFREDLLAAFFSLSALLLAAGFPTRRTWTTLLLGGGCTLSMLAAVASKESGVAAPGFLLVYWLVVRRGGEPRPWAGLITSGFVVAFAFLAARFAMEPQHSVIYTSKPPYVGGSFSAMMATQPRIWIFQASQILWPTRLCADHTPYSFHHIDLSAAMLGLATLVLVVGWLSRRNPGVGLGAAFCMLAMLPVSNLVPIYRPVADRYLYLPLVGLSVALGAAICRWTIVPKRWMAGPALAAAAIIYGFFSVLTVQRAFVWQDNRSLWEDTVARNPYSFTAHNNLGFALFDDAEFEDAAHAFGRACELAPDQPDCLAGLAMTYDALGRSSAAEEALLGAIERDPRYGNPARLVEALTWRRGPARKLQRVADRALTKIE